MHSVATFHKLYDRLTQVHDVSVTEQSQFSTEYRPVRSALLRVTYQRCFQSSGSLGVLTEATSIAYTHKWFVYHQCYQCEEFVGKVIVID